MACYCQTTLCMMEYISIGGRSIEAIRALIRCQKLIWWTQIVTWSTSRNIVLPYPSPSNLTLRTKQAIQPSSQPVSQQCMKKEGWVNFETNWWDLQLKERNDIRKYLFCNLSLLQPGKIVAKCFSMISLFFNIWQRTI